MKENYLTIQVDDGLMIVEDESLANKLLKEMKENFKMTVTENPKSYFKMEINKENCGYFLKQEKYASKVIQSFNMENTKPKANYIC